MQKYMWFHPTYIKKSDKKLIQGQKNNARSHGYIVLRDGDLKKVEATDHLTVVGHSTPPSAAFNSGSDTGHYIQGDNAQHLTVDLTVLGLRYAPKLLTLECCRAGIHNGLAQQLSKQAFFKYTMIEACNGAVGRNPGTTVWNVPTDTFGRSVPKDKDNIWNLYLRGHYVASYKHGSALEDNLLDQISPRQFHRKFIKHYTPGFFGGRAIRHCLSSSNGLITLEDALLLARKAPKSSSATAVDKTLEKHDFSQSALTSLACSIG